MERPASLKRLGRGALWCATFGGAVALVYSCAARPASAPPSARAIAPVANVPGPPAPVRKELEPVAAGGFSPVLAEPRFAGVQRELERARYGAAADEFAKLIAAAPPPADALARHRFLYGRLLERAGRAAAARDEFVAVTALPTPLVEYAELGAARTELALGRADAALRHLGRTSEALPRAAGRRRLLAEALLGSGARPAALREFRAWYQEAGDDAERQLSGLRWLEVLAERRAEPIEAEDVAAGIRAARRLAVLASDDAARRARATGYESALLARLPPAQRAEAALASDSERLDHLRLHLAARRYAAAQTVADSFPAFDASAGGEVDCELQLLRGKLAAATRKGDAVATYAALATSGCSDELRARGLYLAGKAASSADRHADAVRYYGELEQRYATNSLADDARLLGALSWQSLGDEAKFVERLNTIADDYPRGDLTVEGCFRLSLRRMEKGDYGSAEQPLLRALTLVDTDAEASRGADFSGRERYFLAKARLSRGFRDQALAGFEEILDRLPLGYYSRLAYSELYRAEPARAKRLLEQLALRSHAEPFRFASAAEPGLPAFQRALELLAVGEPESAASELTALAPGSSGAAPELLYSMAVLYARAGAFKLASEAARQVLGSAPPRFPAGEWLAAWRLSYPEPYPDLVTAQARASGVPSSLIYAVMREESAFDPNAESPADAYGLMQIIVPTAKWAAKPLGLPYDAAALRRPSVNITLGARVLANYRSKFPDNPLLAVAAYNAGPGAPLRWIKQRPVSDFDLWIDLIPYVETRRYIKRVLASEAVYAMLFEADPGEALLLPARVSG